MFIDEKAAGEAKTPDFKLGTLKLSGAIRVGSKLRGQCVSGDYFKDGKSCALGAAYEALGGVYEEQKGLIASEMSRRYDLPRDTVGMVVNFNDTGKSREWIADWLESQGF